MPDPTDPPAQTVGHLLAARRHDDAPGLLFEDRSWSWAEVVAESDRRAGLLRRRLGTTTPPHVGVLLDNVPEYLFWLGGAALAGACVVGVNPTRRGAELARDVRFTDCRLLVTDDAGAALLDPLDTGVPEDALVRVTDVPGDPAPLVDDPVIDARPEDLLLLLFTSGTTGAPKAVRCTQGRLAAIGERAGALYDFRRDDVCYCPMPLFHGNAVMALWAPALAAGAAVALTRRFSASGFLSDVRHHRATRFTYVGKALAYVLATPERGDDADNTLRIGFGTEASAPDRDAFARRFGCTLVEGYGSSEGGVAINVTTDTPPGSLGKAPPGVDVAVCRDDGTVCAPARFDTSGRLLNAADAIGEIVNRSGVQGFEGYYGNNEADSARTRGGWYWTGDLGYRDEAGFFYFAGRGGDWLRVDSENFAAAPIERILERHPDVAAAAVYPVPDPRTGDRVMAALQLRPGAAFDGASFAAWLSDQPDLGTKWAPGLVRLCPALPLTATGKITKTTLRAEAWECEDPVYLRPPRATAYAPLDADGRAALRAELERHGRGALLPATRRP
ncbi:MAG TPA: AMP-binding protein [Acidimicrobiales bacterium]|nr:AMP-binding protein [Acidimicrobiales bacterium]